MNPKWFFSTISLWLSLAPTRHTKRESALGDDLFSRHCHNGHSKASAGQWLEITTRFSAADERSRVRLLDAWALVGPVASMLVERAARGVKAYAEREAFEGEEREGRRLRAA